jgi:hypothetical protein
MRLAANNENLSQDVRDSRLESARRLLRSSRKTATTNSGALLASAGLAVAALLLASLVVGGGGHSTALQAPTSGSDVAPSMRGVVTTTAPHADFELSANPGTASAPAAPAETTPPVRDAVLIGTEGESR